MQRLFIAGIVGFATLAYALIPTSGQDKKPKKLPDLVKQLRDKEPEIRVAAVEAIAKLDPDVAVPVLVNVLAMPDEELRLHAALALGAIGKAAVPQLTKALGHEHETVRFYAVWALGLVGPAAKDATPAVIKALRDEDEEVRYKAAFALARIAPDSTDAIAALIGALQDPDPDVAVEAGDALAKVGVRAVPALRKALGDRKLQVLAADALAKMAAGEDPDAAKAAAAAVPDIIHALEGATLGEAGTLPAMVMVIGPKALPALREAAKDNDPQYRARVALAAGLIGQSAEGQGDAAGALGAVELLVRLLGDGDPIVRQAACRNLVPMSLHLDVSQPALEKAYLDEAYGVAHHAFAALVSKAPDSTDRLARRMAKAKGDEQLRLACLIPANHEALLEKNVKHASAAIRLRIACALAGQAPNSAAGPRLVKQIMPILTEALKSPVLIVRRDAVEALQKLAPSNGAAVPALLIALQDKDAQVRSGAAAALIGAQGREFKAVAAALVPLLDDTDAMVQMTAINAMRDCGAAGVPHLTGLLKHREPLVRMQAVQALAELKEQAKESIPALVTLAKSLTDRWLAVHALQQVAPARSTTLLLEMLQSDKAHSAALRRAAKESKDVAKVVAGLVRGLPDADLVVSRDAAAALSQVVLILLPADCTILQKQKVLPAMKQAVARADKALSAKSPEARRQAAEAMIQLRMLLSMVEFRAANNPVGDVSELINRIEPVRSSIEAALERARNDSDPATRRLVRRALRQNEIFGGTFPVMAPRGSLPFALP
jgi:HEAT repeat protein